MEQSIRKKATPKHWEACRMHTGTRPEAFNLWMHLSHCYAIYQVSNFGWNSMFVTVHNILKQIIMTICKQWENQCFAIPHWNTFLSSWRQNGILTHFAEKNLVIKGKNLTRTLWFKTTKEIKECLSLHVLLQTCPTHLGCKSAIFLKRMNYRLWSPGLLADWLLWRLFGLS